MAKVRTPKKLIRKYQEELRTPPNKKKTKPGPWTLITPKIRIEANLSPSVGLSGEEAYGNYVKDPYWRDKAWFPVLIKITSESQQEDIATYGLDEYMAAAEVSLNTKRDELRNYKYGKLVLLEIQQDKSNHPDPAKRFICCRAKTNKKDILGFRGYKNGKYGIITHEQSEC